MDVSSDVRCRSFVVPRRPLDDRFQQGRYRSIGNRSLQLLPYRRSRAAGALTERVVHACHRHGDGQVQ